MRCLKAIAAGKASARLLQERSVTISLESSGLPGVADRIAALLKGLPPADQKLERSVRPPPRRLSVTPRPTLARGPRSSRSTVQICHQLGGKGARVGPQLDGIGSRGLDRLMEDILDPNRNVDQTFRVTNLALKNGQIVTGLLLREEGEVLILADSQGKEIRVPRSSVEERSISPLSPMPANLVDQIAEDDFYRLMAFLLSKREPTSPAGWSGNEIARGNDAVPLVSLVSRLQMIAQPRLGLWLARSEQRGTRSIRLPLLGSFTDHEAPRKTTPPLASRCNNICF